MNFFLLLSVLAPIALGARLSNNRYLPPENALTAGGNDQILDAPVRNNYNQVQNQVQSVNRGNNINGNFGLRPQTNTNVYQTKTTQLSPVYGATSPIPQGDFGGTTISNQRATSYNQPRPVLNNQPRPVQNNQPRPVQNNPYQPIQNDQYGPPQNNQIAPVQNNQIRPVKNNQIIRPAQNKQIRPVQNSIQNQQKQNVRYQPQQATNGYQQQETTAIYQQQPTTSGYTYTKPTQSFEEGNFQTQTYQQPRPNIDVRQKQTNVQKTTYTPTQSSFTQQKVTQTYDAPQQPQKFQGSILNQKTQVQQTFNQRPQQQTQVIRQQNTQQVVRPQQQITQQFTQTQQDFEPEQPQQQITNTFEQNDVTTTNFQQRPAVNTVTNTVERVNNVNRVNNVQSFQNTQQQNTVNTVNTVTNIQQSEDAGATILDYYCENDGSGTYRFGFETSNGIRREESGELVDSDHHPNGEEIVKGSYSYTAPDGQVFTVRYTADAYGFHPEGDHLPTPPPTPEAILKLLKNLDQRWLPGGSQLNHDTSGHYVHDDSGTYNHEEHSHDVHTDDVSVNQVSQGFKQTTQTQSNFKKAKQNQFQQRIDEDIVEETSPGFVDNQQIVKKTFKKTNNRVIPQTTQSSVNTQTTSFQQSYDEETNYEQNIPVQQGFQQVNRVNEQRRIIQAEPVVNQQTDYQEVTQTYEDERTTISQPSPTQSYNRYQQKTITQGYNYPRPTTGNDFGEVTSPTENFNEIASTEVTPFDQTSSRQGLVNQGYQQNQGVQNYPRNQVNNGYQRNQQKAKSYAPKNGAPFTDFKLMEAINELQENPQDYKNGGYKYDTLSKTTYPIKSKQQKSYTAAHSDDDDVQSVTEGVATTQPFARGQAYYTQSPTTSRPIFNSKNGYSGRANGNQNGNKRPNQSAGGYTRAQASGVRDDGPQTAEEADLIDLLQQAGPGRNSPTGFNNASGFKKTSRPDISYLPPKSQSKNERFDEREGYRYERRV